MGSIVRKLIPAVALIVIALGTGGTSAASAQSALDTVQVPAGPDAMVAVGPNLWVASCTANAVTEINRSTYQIVQTLTGPNFGFDCPYAIAAGDGYIWVANVQGSSLSQLNASTGAWVQTITGSNITDEKSTFENIVAPVSLIVVKNDLWVYNESDFDNLDNQDPVFVSEFNATTGATVRNLVPRLGTVVMFFGLNDAGSFAYTGTGIWIGGGAASNSSEILASNGRVLRSLQIVKPGYPPIFSDNYLSYHSGALWIAEDNGFSEYNGSSGKYIRSVHTGTAISGDLVFTGRDVFVVLYRPISAIREYDSKGTFVRTVAKFSSKYGGDDAILFDGTGLWFANNLADTVAFYPVTN